MWILTLTLDVYWPGDLGRQWKHSCKARLVISSPSQGYGEWPVPLYVNCLDLIWLLASLVWRLREGCYQKKVKTGLSCDKGGQWEKARSLRVSLASHDWSFLQGSGKPLKPFKEGESYDEICSFLFLSRLESLAVNSGSNCLRQPCKWPLEHNQ